MKHTITTLRRKSTIPLFKVGYFVLYFYCEYHMEVEELMINLKIIEKLEINQKLITRDTYLNIERTSLIPEWMRRWNRQDNRNETIKKINAVVNDSIFLLNKNETLCAQYELKDALLSSIKGLNNLKETYVICNQTFSRIELIIEKINKATEK